MTLTQIGEQTEGGSVGKTLVALDGVTKRFGTVVALDSVNLQVPAGSFFALLGPSGCGKTTLLRILAGFEQPDSGQLLLDGVNLAKTPPERRPFNLVFQQYALFPHLTVGDNVAFGLTTGGRGRGRARRGEIHEKVGRMLELVRLGGLVDRLPSQLSGGQAQRVALARALINEPRLLLLDEPLAALDRNVRHAMREELLRIHSEVGTTFVLVTHDQDEALTMSTEIALMNAGGIEQVASPEDLYRRPVSLFAARFVGAGSFLEGHVVGQAGDRVRVEVAGHTLEPTLMGTIEGDRVTLVLRPEEVRVTTSEAGLVQGHVMAQSFLGHHYELTVDTPVGLVRAQLAQPVQDGSLVALAWDPGAGLAYTSDHA
jgi:ABC-type Fe3+/spermidine/putrescine transport system ATPase subunit